jgi:hypothetical protein
MSNSLALKNSGGGGGGAITCLEDTTGSPAKVATACDAMATTAKAINLFIGVVLQIRLFSMVQRAEPRIGPTPLLRDLLRRFFDGFFPLVPFFITRALMSSLTSCSVVLHPSADFVVLEMRKASPRFRDFLDSARSVKASNHICGTVMPRCP